MITKIGYGQLIEEIKARHVIMPSELKIKEELMAWLNGYAKCENDILDLIRKKQEGLNIR